VTVTWRRASRITIHIANGADDTMGSSMCQTHASNSRMKSWSVGCTVLLSAPVVSRTLLM